MRLAVRIHGSPERLFETSETRVTIGRGQNNVLAIDNPHVSSQHARIERGAGGVTLADLGSTNGSMIQRGSRRIPVEAGGASVKIEVNDTLVLGDTEAPVSLVLLDDGIGGGTHPVVETPTTAVAEAPVDTSAGGKVLARLARDAFDAIDPSLLDSPGAGRALYDLAIGLAEQDETSMVEAAARALFALCPNASHLFASVGGTPEQPHNRRLCFARGGGDARWIPSRMAQVRATLTGEAWLVGEVRVDESGDATRGMQRVATAVVAPLAHAGKTLGVIVVDSRSSRTSLDEGDLRQVAAVAHLLALGLAVTSTASRPGTGARG